MPPTDQQGLPALITIGVSHYCEKARWALQRYSIPYTEECHVPGAHRFATKAAGGRGSVPCLRLPAHSSSSSGTGSGSGSGSGSSQSGQQCVDESTPILRWIDAQRLAAAAAKAAALAAPGSSQQQPAQQQPQQAQQPPELLFPPGDQGAEVERLCEHFDKRLGPAVRLWAYSHLLYTPAIAEAMVAPPVPLLERVLLRCGGWLMLRRLMYKGLGTTPERGAAALLKIKSIFDEVGALLADGRPYLTGSTFTAADLTFAALAAPAVGQPYAAAPGLDEETPGAMRQQIEELRAHPAGQFVLRLWETQRGVVVGSPGVGVSNHDAPGGSAALRL